MQHFIYTTCLICSTFFAAYPLNSKSAEPGMGPQRAGISFTENKGQVHDQNYQARPDVLYGTMIGNLGVHIRKDGVSYQIYRVEEWKESLGKKQDKEIEKLSICRIDLSWLNVNQNSTRSEDGVLPDYNNYYSESCPEGALKVRSYKTITLHNLYPGIDLLYYEKDGQLKHDYRVAPGADYRKIQIKVEGASIQTTVDGSVLLNTAFGQVQEGAPKVFQNGKLLKAKWVISDNILSYNIENFDPNSELLIDPVTRLWGTYYGGNGDERSNASKSDATGNVFMVGRTTTNTSTLIATTGMFQTTLSGGYDSFLVKFNSNGVRLWGTYYGASDYEDGVFCSTDALGNVYLAGRTASNNGFVIASPGGHQTTYGGNYDSFLAKFNSNGMRLWATYYGGTGDEETGACATDALGNIFLTGNTYEVTGGTVIATSAAHQATFGGGIQDAFLVKFNSNGVRQWGTFYGGSDTDYGKSCSTDALNNVYLAGRTFSTNDSSIATANAHQTQSNGGSEAFLVKFNNNGVRQWGTYYGGSDYDVGNSSYNDPSGNVYLAGWTTTETGTTFVSPGAHQSTFGGGSSDSFLAKFNSQGVRQWGTYYGGIGYEDYNVCTCDASGNVYLCGRVETDTGSAIASPGAYQAIRGGLGDAFLVKFNGSGSRLWGTYYGGSHIDDGTFCHADPSGNIYLTGYTASTNNTVIASSSAHQPTANGTSFDGFLVKFTTGETDIEQLTLTENHISIYPNPNHGILNIDLSRYSAHSQIMIYDYLGLFINSGKLEGLKNTLDISYLNPGFYFLQVLDQDKVVFTVKLIRN